MRKKKFVPSEEIAELIDEILSVYKEDSWLVVKKYVLKYTNSENRKLFSTRHPKTKKHITNDYEENLIKYCSSVYKRKLYLHVEDREDLNEAQNKKRKNKKD